MAVFKLRIQEPNKAPRDVDVVVGMTIGRAATNRCVLDDASASGEHARIVDIGGALAIQDVGSANKTRVEGGPSLAKDQNARLVSGMRLTIGGTKLEVVGEEDDDAGATMQRAKKQDDDAGATMQRARRVDPEQEAGTIVRPKSPRPPEVAAQAVVGEDATIAKRSPAPAPKHAPQAAPPRPAPAPRAVPVPAVVPASSARPAPANDDDFDAGGAEMTAAVGSPEFEPALLQATLSEAKPRLVFRAKKQGSIVAITEPANVLGRKAVGDVNIALDDDGVSSRHARLTLGGRTFWIEDMGSKNHTLLDKEQLAPKVKRALHGDCWLRIGTIDVLFVTERVAGMESPEPAMYDEAIAFLAETGALAGESLEQARATRRKEKHPAQDLIAAGAITVAQWHDAITTAKLRVRANVPGRGKGNKPSVIVIALIVLVVILVAVVIWMAKSGK